ncbi:HMG-Y-related protein A [Canna indica]|uniref:HMG-Y-related protein A n=1 Tax=Canna indica TaxID=4628 RepID=A0AAQ3KJC9_9LILI|nr:HMG-Y-related protein A [Canna indica]
MATDEATKPSSLPPYPEMIMAAIAALGEKGGSSEAAIAEHIESACDGWVPESHASVLSEHLARMKDAGELVCVDGNYSQPSSDEPPPKRGRGRPPKPKTDADPPKAAVPAGPPRPRGRPPKPKDPLAAAVAMVNSGLPRRRGRPPMKKDDAVAVPVPVAPASGVKRGRGRPPKAKPAVENDVA